MKILLIVTNADRAGAPIHVRDLAFGLTENNVSVEIVFGEHGPIKDEVDARGIDTHVIESLRSAISPFEDLRSIIFFLKIAKNSKPDIIHAHSSKAGLVARIVGLFLKVPVVYTIHGWGFGSGRKAVTGLFVYLSELITTKFTSHYIAVSRADESIGIKFLKIPPSNISVIYNSTNFNPKTSSTPTNTTNLIMVARNDRQKDYRTFFKSLSNSDVNRIDVVGKGTDEKEFADFAKSLAGQNFSKIRFLGPRNDIESLLEDCSLFVLSSRFEGLPISIIEAMSKGLAIVATDVGGVPELVSHGVNGYLCRPGDSLQLSEYINKLSRHNDIRLSFGAASLTRFKNDFSIDAMINKTIAVYIFAFRK